MKVFLTGGPGLIGTHTAGWLRARGHDVVALHRPTSRTERLEELRCSLVEGDVQDARERLADAMVGCTHVVHGAALVYAGDNWPRIRAVNVEGTRTVLEAAADAGVRHAVHISSVAVYGTVAAEVDETAPIDAPVPPGDLYARSKREAERAAREVEAQRDLTLTILRPAAVYGEWDRLMAPRIARMLRGPVAVLLGGGRNTLPAVYAGNVAEAVGLAVEAGRGGTTWNVGLDHPLTQRDLLHGLAQGLGRVPRFVGVPAPLVRHGADVLEWLGVSAPGAPHLPLGRVARLALGENPYPSRAIREDLGWDPPHRPHEALVRTGRWLSDHISSHGAES